MAHHSATLFAPKQIAISLLPSRGTIHIYFLLRELTPPPQPSPAPCVGAICCFLLLWFSFIHFQHSLNATIVCCWNVPKQRNKDGEQKDDFLTLKGGWERKRDRQTGREARKQASRHHGSFLCPLSAMDQTYLYGGTIRTLTLSKDNCQVII